MITLRCKKPPVFPKTITQPERIHLNFEFIEDLYLVALWEKRTDREVLASQYRAGHDATDIVEDDVETEYVAAYTVR